MSSIAPIIILVIMLLILSSLGYGLFNLLYKRGNTQRTAASLTARISLSMILFLGLLSAMYSGWIIPNPIPL